MIFGDSPTMRNDRYMPSVHAILQSSNLFMFTMHNPVRWVDPGGTFAVDPWAMYQAAKYAYQMGKPYVKYVWDASKKMYVQVITDAARLGRWIQSQAARQEQWVINQFNSIFGGGGAASGA